MELKIAHVRVIQNLEQVRRLDDEQLKAITDLSKEGWEIKAVTPMNVDGQTLSVCFTLQRQSAK